MMAVAQDRCAPTSYVPQGLPGLLHHDQEKVRLGSSLLEHSVLLYKAAYAKGIPVFLENPFQQPGMAHTVNDRYVSRLQLHRPHRRLLSVLHAVAEAYHVQSRQFSSFVYRSASVHW